MFHQEFHSVEIALCSFMDRKHRIIKRPNRIHFRAVLQNRPHGRDVVPDGISMQRPTFVVIIEIGICVVVQEQLHHLGRPRSMHGAESALVILVEVFDFSAFFQ
jgi:hypothetical protein